VECGEIKCSLADQRLEVDSMAAQIPRSSELTTWRDGTTILGPTTSRACLSE
jgi:hypothetical protein